MFSATSLFFCSSLVGWNIFPVSTDVPVRMVFGVGGGGGGGERKREKEREGERGRGERRERERGRKKGGKREEGGGDSFLSFYKLCIES